jgi:hypothetical protein
MPLVIVPVPLWVCPCLPSHHVSHFHLIARKLPFFYSFFSTPMDFKSTHGTFLSRVYTTPHSSDNSRHLSATQTQATTPSFFGKSHISHSGGRRPGFHTASTGRQDDSSTSLLPSVDTQDSSIYAGFRTHRYFPRSIESINTRPPHGNMDDGPHVPHLLKPEPIFSMGQTGTLMASVLNPEF